MSNYNENEPLITTTTNYQQQQNSSQQQSPPLLRGGYNTLNNEQNMSSIENYMSRMPQDQNIFQQNTDDDDENEHDETLNVNVSGEVSPSITRGGSLFFLDYLNLSLIRNKLNRIAKFSAIKNF